jgi:citrate lyase subunit beta/citryl-CoA lyase
MSEKIEETARPRRSALYMPAANARALEKARTLDADVLIFDLEDAVAPDAKMKARTQAAAALAQGGYGHREVVIRINGLDTPWGRDDLDQVASLGANAILLPKVESARQVRDAALALEAAGGSNRPRLWAMIETPLGVMNIREIADSHPLLNVLVMGTSDLVNDLHARHTRGRAEVITALSLVVMAARAYGLAVLDGVHLALNEATTFQAICEQGRDLGFDGKTLIHPDQIAAANAVYGPSPEEVSEARKRVSAFAAARAVGEGMVVVDGKLVEALHIQDAVRVLALDASISSRDQ